VRGAAGAGDDHLEALGRGARGEIEQRSGVRWAETMRAS
jgi:hypothetical protein